MRVQNFEAEPQSLETHSLPEFSEKEKFTPVLKTNGRDQGAFCVTAAESALGVSLAPCAWILSPF